MLKRPSEHRLTLEERVAVVIATVVAIGVHVAVFLVGSGIGHLSLQEKKRERLMVIRRVREITPAPDIAVRVPDPRRVQVAAEPGPEGRSGGSPPPPPAPQQKVSDRGTLPPLPKPEISPRMEEDLQVSVPPDVTPKPAEQKSGEVGDNSVSVVTDLPAASFTLSGPAEYRGTGTFWIRRGAPSGTYRIAFSAAEGYGTPPPQTKELAEKGQIVFVGKYRRSTEIVVDANANGASFTVYRPDGRPVDLSTPGRALFDDLPPGNYTVVFRDVPGFTTPVPSSQTLSPGGRLSFYGEYKASGRGSGAGAGSGTGSGSGVGSGSGTGSGLQGSGRGGGGSGSGRGRGAGHGPAEAELDRRVQLVVKSYPRTDIEETYPPIAYPEVVIRKSNFQQGWCQVYLVITVDGSGDVANVLVERPRPADRAQYEALIRTVEASVRSWDYDKVSAEVHVDARFYVE